MAAACASVSRFASYQARIAAVWSRRRPDGEPSRARLSGVPMNARYCSNVLPDANRSGVTTLSFRSIIATPLDQGDWVR